MTKAEAQGHAAMFSANLMWGLMAPFAKLALIGGAVTPLLISDLRIGGAMILFWAASMLKPAEHVPPRDLARLFAASLLAIVFNQGCYMFGVGLTSPTDASIITTSMPLWAMILAAFILKEPITAMKIGGILTGAAGALLLICGGRTAASGGGNYVLGDLLVLAAQFSYAMYLVVFKNFIGKYSMATVMKWMFTFAFVCVLPFSVKTIAATNWGVLSLEVAGSLVFIVVCATFLTYSLVVVGQKNLRPTVAGMYNYVQPVVASLVAVALGMDRFTPVKLVAVVLIFLGVMLVTRSKSRSDLDAAKKSSIPGDR